MAAQADLACTSHPAWPKALNNTGYFDRGVCFDRAREWSNDTEKTLPEHCLKLLFRNTTVEDMTLTFLGCNQFCGRDQGWYSNPDALERVLTWIFPIFFLLFNLKLPAIGWEKFFAITHAIGDPIDSVWSLLDKIYAWEKCHAFAEEFVTEEESIRDEVMVNKAERLERIKVIGTTFAGIEEIMGYRPDSESIYWDIASSLGLMKTTEFDEWRRAATTLVDDRTNDFIRTGVAIGLFIFQFFSELVFDSDKVPPGGRLGSAMLLSWLIPLVLISNIMGGVASRRTCLRTIICLVENIRRNQGRLLNQRAESRHWDDYFDKVYSTGAIYISRPHKVRVMWQSKGKEKIIRMILPFFSTLVVIFGFIPAFYIHWMAAPNGFSCRHFWIIGVSFAWAISPIITATLQTFTRYKLWVWFILVKDILIGFGSIIMLLLSVAGLFNSCLCWSLYLSLGEALAYFPLNTTPIYALYGRTIYRDIIISFLAAQIFFVIVVVVFFRRGLWLWRYGEDPKRAVWNRLEGTWVLDFLKI
ncbi:hypothetical protein TWF679_003898 [Orbilia oligospora]|uniref:Uncharacterized protein n=1 Tax=Orbilia oligospora TaxID=2813651 RepID=A0A8H8UQM8_ORBOL|nr:hypothetical protein TWF679_003898 [Orbilia oligospora]